MAISRVHQDNSAIWAENTSGCLAQFSARRASISFGRTCFRHSHGLAVLLILLAGAVRAGAQLDVLVAIEVHGNRSVPAEAVRAHIFSRPGDVYDPAAIERDFNSLWNTGYFEDIRFEREATPKGWILHVYVKEKPRIKEINYLGISAISKSDILDRFKEAKVGISVESQYDPTKAKKASHDQAAGGGAWAPVRHRPHRSAGYPAGFRGHHVCGPGRTES